MVMVMLDDEETLILGKFDRDGITQSIEVRLLKLYQKRLINSAVDSSAWTLGSKLSQANTTSMY